MKNCLLAAAALLCSSSAFALDSSELASLTQTVQAICVHPDRIGDYLRTEGEVKVGAPVYVFTGELSGKITYEKWRGISIAADKYKTDPRQCTIEVLKLLQPELTSSKGSGSNQTTYGPKSPNIGENKGTINIH